MIREHNQLHPLARNYQQVHVELGHPSESFTNATAKVLGVQSPEPSNCVYIALGQGQHNEP